MAKSPPLPSPSVPHVIEERGFGGGQRVEPQQVAEGQCGTCGAQKPPEDMYRFWFTRLVTPPGMEGTTLVCDDCKMFVMTMLCHMPDRGPAPLKGYT